MKFFKRLKSAVGRVCCHMFKDKAEIDEFKRCCEIVAIRRASGDIPDDDFWELYGYFKQAVNGDFDVEDTSDANDIDLIKWEQWKRHRGMSKKDAKMAYIKTVREKYAHLNVRDIAFSPPTCSHSRMKVVEEEPDMETNAEGFLTLAANNNVKEMAKLLSAIPELIETKTAEGITALHFAADRGHINVAKCLIAHGANINALDDHRDTPILAAAAAGHRDMVEFLIKAGADVSVRNIDNVCLQDLIETQ